MRVNYSSADLIAYQILVEYEYAIFWHDIVDRHSQLIKSVTELLVNGIKLIWLEVCKISH